jgi:predicted chitinase
MSTEREIQMLHAAREAGITSRAELANFMAQVSSESGNLTRLEEGFSYTRSIEQIPPRWARRQGLEVLEDARRQALAGNAEPLSELMYGGRMGNNQPGDGYRYRGRGYIQLTGRENYTSAGRALGLDLAGNPDLAAEPANAARIAVWYWQQRIPAHQREDVLEATHRVNGGEEGLDRRFAQFERWNAILTPEFLSDLDANRIAPDGPRVDREDSVRILQQNLNTLGIRDAQGQALTVDGDRGTRTNEAIATFQRQAGLSGEMSTSDLLIATQTVVNVRRALDADRALRGMLPENARARKGSMVCPTIWYRDAVHQARRPPPRNRPQHSRAKPTRRPPQTRQRACRPCLLWNNCSPAPAAPPCSPCKNTSACSTRAMPRAANSSRIATMARALNKQWKTSSCGPVLSRPALPTALRWMR